MVEVLKPDICVIGGGPGGHAAAAAAVAFCVSCVLVEKHAMGGGCLNGGCVSSMALLASAKRAALARGAGAFGVHADVSVDFKKVREHIHRVIAATASDDSAERFGGLGVRVITGDAQFNSRRTISVGEIEIRARRFVIATGSRPAVPPIHGLDAGPYFTDETIFGLTGLPGHLVVIGAGSMGVELAQGYRRLGSAVTLLEAAAPLAKDDPECAAIVLNQLERDGVFIRSGVKVEGVVHAEGRVAVKITGEGGSETVEGTHLLVATGRKPAIEGLNLETARIRYGDDGIVVSRKLKTSNGRIYAIGDVAAGQPRFTHAANYHAGLVIGNALLRRPVNVDNDAIPRVTFTDPELAQAGLTEAEARRRRLHFHVLRWPYHDNDRAQAEHEIRGHIKIIVAAKGDLLGATIVGAQAGELIALWSLAIAQGLNIQAVTGVVFPYPTLSEIGKRAAIDFFTPSLTRPLPRRIIGWLRKFG